MTTKPPDFYIGWTEPESAANTDFQPEYRYNHITQTPRGHSLELDDTPDRERIRLQHRVGTFIEMHPNGDEVHKVYGDGYEITIKNKNILVKGKMNITVEGDCNMLVMGDKIETVEGNYELHVKGNKKEMIDGVGYYTTGSDMRIQAGSSAAATLSISTGDCLTLNCDVSVDGELTASKILSTSRVDAMSGMSAGPLGFVTLLGGVSVGFPVATPLQIMCATNIFSGTTITAIASVNAALGNFALMKATIMTDSVNTNIYRMHTHVAPLGMTSPPLQPMI